MPTRSKKILIAKNAGMHGEIKYVHAIATDRE